MRWRLLIASFFILIFAAALFLVFNDSKKESADTSENPSFQEIVFPVRVERARRGELVKWISAGGIATAKSEVDIVPRLSGQIVKLNVRNGQFVREGELLVKLDDSEYRIALRQAENNLLNARIEYNLMKFGPVAGSAEQERYRKELDSLSAVYREAEEKLKRGMISEEEFYRIKRNYESLLAYSSVNRDDIIANKSGLNQAIAEYEKAKLNLSYTEIKSPISGLVADCFLTEGGFVRAGEKCMKIVNISSIRIIVELNEEQFGKIKLGNIAQAKFIAFPDEVFQGRVVEINPYIDIERRTGKVVVEIENRNGKIKPGMYGSVKIQGETFKNVLLVAKSAVAIRDNRPVIFTVEGDLAKWNYVELGEQNDEFFEVKSGIKPGDTVIVEGNYNLAHDSKVKIE